VANNEIGQRKQNMDARTAAKAFLHKIHIKEKHMDKVVTFGIVNGRQVIYEKFTHKISK